MKPIVKRLDNVWAKIIKLRAHNTCEKCQSTTKQLNACHFYGRRYHSTRWRLDNGICMCVGCHLVWAHSNPYEFGEFMRKRLGKTGFTMLQITKNEVKKVDKQLILTGLEQILKEYENGENNKIYPLQ